jgi:hypothetical protein
MFRTSGALVSPRMPFLKIVGRRYRIAAEAIGARAKPRLRSQIKSSRLPSPRVP